MTVDFRFTLAVQRPVNCSSLSGYRAPSTLIFEEALLISRRSSGCEMDRNRSKVLFEAMKLEIPSFLSMAGPKPKLIPMQPSPRAETSRLLFPSLRFSIVPPWQGNSLPQFPPEREIRRSDWRNIAIAL